MGKGKGSGYDTIPGLEYKINTLEPALKAVKEFIFIRHGEKPSKDEMKEMKHSPDPKHQKQKDKLNAMGRFRAAHLWEVFGTGNTPPGAYSTPDAIYAMKAGDDEASERPFETVKPLAIRLEMRPVEQGVQMPEGIPAFDNYFKAQQHEKLLEDVKERCEDGQFKDKTVLFCWEHKNIPYIVARFGLTDHGITWGSDPDSGEDDHDDFTSIWVFKPRENSFKVYQQFTITANVGNPLQPFTLVPPPGGYGAHGFTAATP